MKKLSIVLMVVCMLFIGNLQVRAEESASIPSQNQQQATGGGGCSAFSGLDPQIPTITSRAVSLIQVAVPVILIVFGMIDFLKAVMSQKEDEIKKAQGIFVKRLLAGALVFFVIFIVKFVVGFVAVDNSQGIMGCIDWFISGP